jgi:EAL domain-containing protein (putative c-di-GMP-specific phosphodiesterase class I)
VGILIRRYKGKSTTFEDDLRKAILQGEIVPYYQPIVNGDTGGLYGVEVLARWKHPKSGFIPPDVFIPIAEQRVDYSADQRLDGESGHTA